MIDQVIKANQITNM